MNDDKSEMLARAWVWALAHHKSIDSGCWRFVRGTPLDFDELRTEVLIDIVERWATGYDPTRGSPSTWIWMRVRAVRRGMVRHGVRNERNRAPDQRDADGRAVGAVDLLALPDASEGSSSRTEARACLHLLSRDHDVVRALVEDWQPATLADRGLGGGRRASAMRRVTTRVRDEMREVAS